MTTQPAAAQLMFQANSQLAALGFSQHQPCIELQQWVQLYWAVQVPEQADVSQIHALYPDGGSNLTFDFIANQRPEVYLQYTQQLSQRSFSVGQCQLSVRFHATGAFQLLGISPAELTTAQLDLTLVNLNGLNWLLEQLASTKDLSVRLTALECWLLQLAEQMMTHNNLVHKSLQLLHQPAADLQHLYQQLPKSRRQFERLFRQETGLSPAQLQLLFKVRQARFLISKNPLSDLASVAQQAGFYDQAHLHQHFVRITGQTPGQYKKRKMSQFSNSER